MGRKYKKICNAHLQFSVADKFLSGERDHMTLFQPSPLFGEAGANRPVRLSKIKRYGTMDLLKKSWRKILQTTTPRLPLVRCTR